MFKSTEFIFFMLRSTVKSCQVTQMEIWQTLAVIQIISTVFSGT